MSPRYGHRSARHSPGHRPGRFRPRRRSGSRQQQPGRTSRLVSQWIPWRPAWRSACKGSPPNTQGIGAKIHLLGGALPRQNQEVIAGGRYLAGSEALLVFAAGRSTGSMTLEVAWRSGRQSRLTDVQATAFTKSTKPPQPLQRRCRPQRGVRSTLCSPMSVRSSNTRITKSLSTISLASRSCPGA